jgi:uncharacterized protein YqgC (DUF456 family)
VVCVVRQAVPAAVLGVTIAFPPATMLDASHGGTITSLLSPSSEAGINECINNLRHLDANNGGISIVVGIIVGLLASLVQSLGLTIQRKSHVINKALPEDQQRVEHRRPYVVACSGGVSCD